MSEVFLKKAISAFAIWKEASRYKKSAVLEKVVSLLTEQKKTFANLILKEAKKPISLAEGEVDRAIDVFRWAMLECLKDSSEVLPLDITSAERRGYGITEKFPKGIVLGITPFNFPLNLVAHKVAPAIAAGCAILIKPSPHTPKTAQALSQLLASIPELPPHLVQVIELSDTQTAQLTQDPRIPVISFTGSAHVGNLIRKQAPEKHLILELGGNAWCVIDENLNDNDLSKAAQRISRAAFQYAGQSCISVQNTAVPKSLYAAFQKHITNELHRFPWGDPSTQTSLCGPLIDEIAVKRSQLRIDLATQKGFVFTPSQSPKIGTASDACYLKPGIFFFKDLTPLQTLPELTQEELFAPVLNVFPYSDLNEVITAINSSPYGLQSGFFSNHLERIYAFYRGVQVGGVVIQDTPTTRYDPQPYGGEKQSGLGREGIRYSISEYSNLKFLALHMD